MIGRAILDGDFVICSPSLQPKDGDIIAARLGDRATIKTLTHRGETVVLEPANPADRAIEVSQRDDFAVLGVVCGVFRPFTEKAADAADGDD
jgi:repressor LexA